ncbi:hypothetical protein AB0O01_13600 [Streptomyces sp. NPDC093252]|uniref:hypothetical protein n=1 Tax=Streptomyces sp. NPDC093252 TaxID=3154980 RepID=UPI003423A231
MTAAVVRWLVAVVGSAAAFAVVAVPWAVLVEGGDDPWDVIGPVAGVAAAGTLAALGWWASQATGGPGVRRVRRVRRVRQSARGGGRIRQTGGSAGTSGSTGSGSTGSSGPTDIRQRARSNGSGDIDQVGGDRG